MSNINVQTIKTDREQFFLVWIKILQSFLKLGKKEQLVLSKILYNRYILTQEIKNKAIVEDLVLSTGIRKKIKDELKIDSASFNNILSALRKKKLLVGNKINNKIIPMVSDDFKSFKLVYNIEINEDI